MKLKKRILCGILSALLLSTNMAFAENVEKQFAAVTSEEVVAYVNFGTEVESFGMTATMGEKPEITVTNKMGREGWVLNPKNMQNNVYIYFDVDEKIAKDIKDGSSYRVEVDYFDEGIASLVMPTAFMSAHVSAVPNHQVGRVTSFETRGSIASCGQFGYELDVTKMTEEELNQIKMQIERYKQIRDVIHKGNMYRIMSPFDGDQCVWQFVSEDKKKTVVCCGSINAKPEQQSKTIKLCGLNSQSTYKLLETDMVYSGSVLMNYGMLLKPQNDFSAELFIFEEI